MGSLEGKYETMDPMNGQRFWDKAAQGMHTFDRYVLSEAVTITDPEVFRLGRIKRDFAKVKCGLSQLELNFEGVTNRKYTVLFIAEVDTTISFTGCYAGAGKEDVQDLVMKQGDSKLLVFHCTKDVNGEIEVAVDIGMKVTTEMLEGAGLVSISEDPATEKVIIDVPHDDVKLDWAAQEGWTDDVLLRYNNEDGLFIEKKQKVLESGETSRVDTYQVPIELEGFLTDVTFFPGTDYVKTLKLTAKGGGLVYRDDVPTWDANNYPKGPVLEGFMYYVKDENDFRVAKVDLPLGYTYDAANWSTIDMPVQKQSDWKETDLSQLTFIKNKPAMIDVGEASPVEHTISAAAFASKIDKQFIRTGGKGTKLVMTALEPTNVEISKIDFMAYFSNVETGAEVNEPFTVNLEGFEASAISATELKLKAIPTDLSAYAKQTEVDAIDTRLTQAEADIDTNKADIGALTNDVQMLEDNEPKYLQWASAFGWTDDLLLRKNDTQGLFLQKKQKVLKDGVPTTADIVSYEMPIELVNITAETTFAPGTDYIASLKLTATPQDLSDYALKADVEAEFVQVENEVATKIAIANIADNGSNARLVMTGLNPSITSDTELHFNGYLSDVETGAQTVVPLDIKFNGQTIKDDNGPLELTIPLDDYIPKAFFANKGITSSKVLGSPITAHAIEETTVIVNPEDGAVATGKTRFDFIGASIAMNQAGTGFEISVDENLDYLQWQQAFGWTDDILFRKNDTDGFFMEKKQKVLHNGKPSVSDIVSYKMPIILEGITTEETFAPGTDYIASLKLKVSTDYADKTEFETLQTEVADIKDAVVPGLLGDVNELKTTKIDIGSIADNGANERLVMTGLNPSIPSLHDVHFNGYLSNVVTGAQKVVPLDILLNGISASFEDDKIKLTRESDDAKIDVANIATAGDGKKWVMNTMEAVPAGMTPDKVTLRVYQSDVENGGQPNITDIPLEGVILPGVSQVFPNGLAGMMTVSDKQALNQVVADEAQTAAALSGLNSTVSTLNTELGNTNSALSGLNATVVTINTELGKTNTELGNTNTELGNTNAALTALNGELTATNTQLNQTTEALFKTTDGKYPWTPQTNVPGTFYDVKMRLGTGYSINTDKIRVSDTDQKQTIVNSFSVTPIDAQSMKITVWESEINGNGNEGPGDGSDIKEKFELPISVDKGLNLTVDQSGIHIGFDIDKLKELLGINTSN